MSDIFPMPKQGVLPSITAEVLLLKLSDRAQFGVPFGDSVPVAVEGQVFIMSLAEQASYQSMAASTRAFLDRLTNDVTAD